MLDALGLDILTLLGSSVLVDNWNLRDTQMYMQQIQPRPGMWAAGQGPDMLIEEENVLYMKGLLHLLLIPGADWSRILHRIYLRAP